MDLIQPMEPILSNNIIDSKEWIHQIKWDGIRGLSYVQGDSIRIFTKKGNERTSFYPELSEVISLFKGSQCIIDGEIVIFDEDGRPSFSNVLMREKVRSKKNIKYYVKKYPVKYIIFDIIYFNGKDLRNTPLGERKKVLVDNFNRSSNITITDDFSDGESLFELMKAKNFEGIVSKNINSNYYPLKKHNDWFKVKIIKKMLVVVGGIKYSNKILKSLLIGIYIDDNLEYIGSVSSGLKGNNFKIFNDYDSYLSSNKSPFYNYNAMDENINWFVPKITCWVSFLEWTNKGSLRHPTIIGFSNMNPSMANGKEYAKG